MYIYTSTLDQKDIDDIKFGKALTDLILYLLFIRNINDVANVREVMGKTETKLIAKKLEDREGIDNFDQILNFVDGIMVARGDMGVEIPCKRFPLSKTDGI